LSNEAQKPSELICGVKQEKKDRRTFFIIYLAWIDFLVAIRAIKALHRNALVDCADWVKHSVSKYLEPA